uniref:Uncharacterized protein n=1 Tax=uncultured prokaryote TaxID=198431 RepID=A0A0H5Q5N0_9ZZZZ|nr:hypothetical protein [uncultured prokaryote]
MPTLPHTSLTAAGSMPGGERWSCTLNFGNFAGSVQPSAAGLQSFANLATDWWEDMVGSADSFMSNIVTLQRVDARNVNGGLTTALASAAPATPVTGGGGASGASLPNQCSVVASLRTEEPGARGRGRIYLPTNKAVVDATGRLPAVSRTQLAAQVELLLNKLNNSAENVTDETGFRLCVVSGVGAGGNFPVTTMRVGDVVDTQRRRRDALVEAYDSRAVLPGTPG